MSRARSIGKNGTHPSVTGRIDGYSPVDAVSTVRGFGRNAIVGLATLLIVIAVLVITSIDLGREPSVCAEAAMLAEMQVNPLGDGPSRICPYPPRTVVERTSDVLAWRSANQRLHRVPTLDGGFTAAIETGLAWTGSGVEPPTLVGLHGLAQTGLNYQHIQVNDAMRARFRMIAIDFRGHGDSFHPPTLQDYNNATLRAWDVKLVLDYLNVVRPPIFVGHSHGVLQAMNYLQIFGPDSVGGFFFMDGKPSSPDPLPPVPPPADFGSKVAFPLLLDGAGNILPTVASDIMNDLGLGIVYPSGTSAAEDIRAAEQGTAVAAGAFIDYLVHCQPPPELRDFIAAEIATSNQLGIDTNTGRTSRVARLGTLALSVDAAVAFVGFNLANVVVLQGAEDEIFDSDNIVALWAYYGVTVEVLDTVGHAPHLEVPLVVNARLCQTAKDVYNLDVDCSLSQFQPALPVTSPIVPWFARETVPFPY